jgi:sugar transferase (PEP-CTERM/EpsH1 system associated)
MKPLIAHIVYSLQIGGLEELVLNLVRKTDPDKYRTAVIVLREDGPLSIEIEKLGAVVYRMNGKEGFSWTLVRRLAALLRREKIDFIHTHDLGPFIYGSLAAFMNGNRNVFHTEHSYLSQNSRRLRIFERWLSLWARMLIADSADVAQMLLEKQNIAPDKVVTILNGIDVQRFAACDPMDYRRELGVNREQLLLGTVGRLVPVKNQALLLRAFARFQQSVVDSQLVLVGEGPERTALQELAQDLKISDRVHFTGGRRDVPRILAALDIFVLPSFSEGLSLTLLEAMAAGKPVIATRVGGNPEVIKDGYNGLLVTSDHVEELLAALLRLAGRSGLPAPELGANARRTVVEKFSLDAMVQEYVAIYDRYDARNRS